MSTVLYSVYKQNIFKLARSIVIKIESAIDAQNKNLVLRRFAVDYDRPDTWMFYKNIAGEYHISNSMMTIESLDDLTTIEFTKDNLLLHTATAKEYRQGGSYYQELLRRFPNQKLLIDGILFPADKQQAIAAKEGDILKYDERLVEENEHNLIYELQRYITNIVNRWNVVGYHQFQDLFPATIIASLASTLPALIEAIRLANTHTIYTHSFHIREFLASHGRLDRYFEALDTKARLWLYRNIRVIKNNIGKQETFNELVENLLSPRGIPLTEYNIRHNNKEQLSEILPNTEIYQKPINLLHRGGREAVLTVEEFVRKVNKVTPYNHQFEEEHKDRLSRLFPYSGVSDIPSKTIESEIVDLSESTYFKLKDVLMSHWLYLSSKGLYRSIVNFTNPNNGEVFRLRANDAYVAASLFWRRLHGDDSDYIGEFFAKDIIKSTLPNKTFLYNKIESYVLKNNWLDSVYDNIIQPTNHIGVESFIQSTEAIYNRMIGHTYQWLEHHDAQDRGEAKAVVLSFYETIKCRPTTYDSYEAWLNSLGIDFGPLDNSAYETMFLEIVANATGIGAEEGLSLKEIQELNLKLMADLSSYMINYVATLLTNPMIDGGTTNISVTSGKNKATGISYTPDIGLNDTCGSSSYSASVDVELTNHSAESLSVFDQTFIDTSLSFGFTACTHYTNVGFAPVTIDEFETLPTIYN